MRQVVRLGHAKLLPGTLADGHVPVVSEQRSRNAGQGGDGHHLFQAAQPVCLLHGLVTAKVDASLAEIQGLDSGIDDAPGCVETVGTGVSE